MYSEIVEALTVIEPEVLYIALGMACGFTSVLVLVFLVGLVALMGWSIVSFIKRK